MHPPTEPADAAPAVAVAPDLRTPDGFATWLAPRWAVMALLASRLAGSAGQDVLQDAAMLAWRTHPDSTPRAARPVPGC